MKKVLIIDLFSCNSMGGGQKYLRKLITILKKQKISITVLSFWKDENDYYNDKDAHQLFIFGKRKTWNKAFFNNLITIVLYIRAKNYLHTFLKLNKFDLIIDNCTCISVDKKYRDKLVFIQHVDEKILFDFKREFLRKILMIKSSFHNSIINVVFTQHNLLKFSKYLPNSNNISIPLFIDKIPIFNKEKNDNIVYIGRTDVWEKNLILLCEVSSFLKEKIHIIGNDTDFVKSVTDKIVYDGLKTHNELINKVLPSIKSLILTSHFEGLPFVVLEAFSCGKPIILRNTFTNAAYLTSDGKGVLLDEKLNAKEISEIIENIDWSTFSSEQIKKFAINEFSNSKFENSWIKIIEKF